MLRLSPRRTAAAAGAILVAILAPCSSLQLATPPERPVALYRAPSPYKEPGRPALSSLIVTSRPVHVNKAEQEGGAGGSQSEGRRGSPAQWRRQLFVSTSLGTGGSRDLPSVHVTTSSTALGIGGGTPPSTTDATLQHVSIECAKGQACSTTIPLRPSTPSTATFKPYSQEALHKFLTDYATVTTAGNATGLGDISQSKPPPPLPPSAPPQDQMPLATDTEPVNRLANLYLEEPLGNNPNGAEDRNGSSVNPGENSKSVGWSLMHATQHKHPYDDRQGWVTLEPVPWSTSHVSKWQSNVQPSRPWDDQGRPLGGGSSWNDLERPPGGGYIYGNGGSGKPYGDRPWNSGGSSAPKPWENNSPGGAWSGQQPNKWDRPNDGRRPGGGAWPQSPGGSDIITGGGPPDFPAHQSGYQNRPGGNDGPGAHRPPQRPWDNNDFNGQRRPPGRHPATHPEEGDGTWVLLSSTRGYSSPPRHRELNQRGLLVSTSRRVRLTVLPADNSTNMTTSHGGLIEVEDSQQSVDESAAMLHHALAQHHNTTLSSYEHLLKEAQRVHAANLIKQALADRNLANATALNDILGAAAALQNPLASPTTSPPQPTTAAPKVKRRKVPKPKLRQGLQTVSAAEDGDKASSTGRADGSVALKFIRAPDTSRRSVALAAVGAGLLPATMAMLVPLMLGRRRRSVTNENLPSQREEISPKDDFISRGRSKLSGVSESD